MLRILQAWQSHDPAHDIADYVLVVDGEALARAEAENGERARVWGAGYVEYGAPYSSIT